MSKLFNQCAIYMFLVVLCSLNGVLYPTGGIVARSFLSVLILVSIVYAIKVNLMNEKLVYFRGLNFLVLLLSIYGVLVVFSGGGLYHGKYVTSTSFLFNIFNSLLPVYAFYFFARQGTLTINNLKFYFFIFLLLAVVSYYQNQYQQRLILQDSIFDFDRLANNTAYIFLGLFPALFFFDKKPLLQFSLLVVIGFFVFSSVKRGAILIFAICVLWFFYRRAKTVSGGKKLGILIAGILLVTAGFFFFTYLMTYNEYFILRLEQTKAGDDSGRTQYYSFFYEHLKNETSFFRLVFGNGIDGSLKLVGQYAHNDWFELAIDTGLLGMIIYLYYWFLYYKSLKSCQQNTNVYSCMGMLWLIYLLMTFFSMSFYSVSYGSSFILGYCLANSSKTLDIRK